MRAPGRQVRLTGLRRIVLPVVTAVTVLYLAVAAEHSLPRSFHPDPLGDGRFTIEARDGTDPAPAAPRGAVTLEALLVDGRLLRWSGAERIQNWTPMDRGVLPSFLQHVNGATPGSISFHATHFVAVLRANGWSGTIRLFRDDVEQHAFDVHSAEGERVILAEQPAVPPSLAIFIGAFAVLACCAWMFGPIKSGRSVLPWLAFFLVVLHVLFWASQTVGTTNDSLEYANGAAQFLLEGIPANFPPGYPLFVGAVGLVAGDQLGRWLAFAQHALAVGAALWIFGLLRRIVAEELALVGALLTGAAALSLTAAQLVMSETATVFAMAGTLYFAVRAEESGRLAFSLLAGALAGWAGAMRVVPLVGLLPAMFLIQCGPRSMVAFQRWLAAAAVAIACILLPSLWHGYRSGQMSLTTATGLHMFNRVVTEQRQVDETGPATRTLTALLGGRDIKGLLCWDVLDVLVDKGWNETSSERLLRSVAIEGIRKDVWGFLAFTPPLAWRILWADSTYWLPPWGDTVDSIPRLENAPVLTFAAAGLQWRLTLEEINRRLWPLVCGLAIMGMGVGVFLPKRRLILAIAWTSIASLLAAATLESFNARYNVPVVPFMSALAVLAVSKMSSAGTSVWRRLATR